MADQLDIFLVVQNGHILILKAEEIGGRSVGSMSCRLGRHLGLVFIILSGLLWRAYTSCEGFHPRIGQSGKVLLADPN